MSFAFVFPGQGTQAVGMCQEFYQASGAARRVFEDASRVLGYDVAEVCFEDPDDVLNSTEYTQPVLLTACVAAYEAFRERCPKVVPSFVAGLSLGEYAALVATGCIDFRDAVRVTRLRGKAMQEAVPKGVGGMAAIVGLDAVMVRQLCSQVSTSVNWVEPANYNCPGQVVVSGHLQAVRLLCSYAKQAGATKGLLLPVSAPFHNQLLRPAGDRLEEALKVVEIRDPSVPVVANVSGQPLSDSAEIRDALIRQVYSPVLMEQALRYMLSEGVTTFVEFGPGRSVSGFVQKINPDATTWSVGDSEGLNALLESLKRE
jgi:[acyl-carrier-protein] S-malonyltransferase